MDDMVSISVNSGSKSVSVHIMTFFVYSLSY